MMKILVVEDDTLIREGLSEFLSESGYSIVQAKDGKEALEKFNTDIHLVILDIQIPYINGLDVLKEIRKESNLPVLILTAKIDGKTIDINAKELEILKYLLDNAGIALTRAQILDHVWKDSEEVPYDRVIDVYIKELRKKLGLDCITTIRNVGYKLEKS